MHKVAWKKRFRKVQWATAKFWGNGESHSPFFTFLPGGTHVGGSSGELGTFCSLDLPSLLPDQPHHSLQIINNTCNYKISSMI